MRIRIAMWLASALFVFSNMNADCLTFPSRVFSSSKNVEKASRTQSKTQQKRITSKRVQTKVTKPATPSKGYNNGHEWVDLGLSVKWATCNVGAITPTEHGTFFAWAETKGKDYYIFQNLYDKNYFWYNKDGDKVLKPKDDAATVNWGENWRMPTESEFEELANNCRWAIIQINGVNIAKGVARNGNFILLPTTGWYDEDGCHEAGYVGSYWTSCLANNLSNIAVAYGFNTNEFYPHYISQFRYKGNAVRPVCY